MMKKIIAIIIMQLTLGCGANNSDSSLNLTSIKPTGNIPIKLYVFDTGHLIVDDVSQLIPGMPQGRQKKLADPTYLIVHPNGTLIWDAGIPDSINKYKSGVDAWGGSWHLTVSKTLKSQFVELDILMSEITNIAFSHLHGDHTSNAAYFKNANLLLQEEVFDLAFSDEAPNFGYNPSDYKIFESNITKLNGIHDVFSDGSVVIIPTPGHALGHQVLYIDLPKTGPILLSGDLYILEEQRKNYWIPNGNDKKQSIQSFAMIDRFLERTNSTLWIQHDNRFFQSLKLAPNFYD